VAGDVEQKRERMEPAFRRHRRYFGGAGGA
jgi:hypothetical protein